MSILFPPLKRCENIRTGFKTPLIQEESPITPATDEIPFPENFLWGTSVSSHQVEGGNRNSWTEWEELPGRIKNGERSGLACDHWNRFREDFDLLVWLNANTHRFSLEWSRLEPEQGQWNREAAGRYREMLQALHQRKIRPMVCLFHFTLPLWAARKGGFENFEVVEAFAAFAKRAVEEFGDMVTDWLTLNEPVVYALGGYAAGLTPPGFKDFRKTMRVMVHMLRAHGLAFHLMKAAQPGAQISFAQHLRVFTPRWRFWPTDLWAASVADQILNWSWYETIQTGKISVSVPTVFRAREEAPECLGALDFLGFNYYGRDLITVNFLSQEKFGLSVPALAEKTDLGWEIFPQGLEYILRGIKKHDLDRYPILITENGLADANDGKRPSFIYSHLHTFLRMSRELELQPMGYLHWSLIDNFEWVEGFGPRFGLFAMDYDSQTRRPRPSAEYFRQMGQKKTVFKPFP